MKIIDVEDVNKVIEESKFQIKISGGDMFTKSDVNYILDQVRDDIIAKGISATINRRIDNIVVKDWRPNIDYSERLGV